MRLRDGSTAADPRLDRLIAFDERSRKFPVRAGLEDKPLRSYSWNKRVTLDQGREGACVGFSWSHELNARPATWPVDTAVARELYRQAQIEDEWPETHEGGEEGTSILAAARILHRQGFFKEYRWAFSEHDLALAVGYTGPAVIGVPWYSGMMRPDDKGFISPTGSLLGYHAILVPSISLKKDAYRLDNSWGPDWGVRGSCWVSRADMRDALLPNNGEACIPVGRVRPSASRTANV